MSKLRIPKPTRLAVRCPLCHAEFDRKVVESRRAHLLQMVQKWREKYQKAVDSKDEELIRTTREWGETLDQSIKDGAAEAFFCHFCKIAIACNDPFVGRWEEAYAKGEKIMCPACDHEMRFFATSTGYMLAQCPVKKCRSRMELSAPDRSKDAANQQLFDSAGNPIALPNVNDAIATPETPALGQVMGAGVDPNLPAVVEIPKPGSEFKQ